MSTIQTIDNELPATARPKLNANFAALNAGKPEKSANLSDLENAATARTNLGLGTAATKDVGTGSTQVAAGNHAHAGVYEPANANIQAHVASTSNPHAVTAAQVGLGSVLNAEQVKAGVGTGKQYASTLYDNGNGGSSKAIDWANGNVQRVTLNAAACTLTFSNPIAGARYALIVLQDATGGRAITWPTVRWAGGTAPTLTTTAGKKDVIGLIYDGADYLGAVSQNF